MHSSLFFQIFQFGFSFQGRSQIYFRSLGNKLCYGIGFCVRDIKDPGNVPYYSSGFKGPESDNLSYLFFAVFCRYIIDHLLAFFKAEVAAQQLLQLEGTVLITVSPADRPEVYEVARQFSELGFKIKSTEGTHRFLTEKGIEAENILKLYEGRPNIVDAIMNGEIQLVVNTPSGKLSQYDDSYIRKTAIKYKIPYITTLAAARAAIKGIEEYRRGNVGVKSLQAYHADIV